MTFQLSSEQVKLQKQLAKNLHSAFDKSLENAPVLSDFLGAESVNLDGTDQRSQRALLELLLDQALGRWLDLWGYLFRVERKENESDTNYRARIIKETIRPRMNEISIEDVLNDDDPLRFADVFTPLTKVMFWSKQGAWSSDWHFADGKYWHGAVIDVVTDNYQPVVEYLINRNRAAGVFAWLRTRICQKFNGVVLGVSDSDSIYIISALLCTIRGRYRAEDITNLNTRVGSYITIPNVQTSEEDV